MAALVVEVALVAAAADVAMVGAVLVVVVEVVAWEGGWGVRGHSGCCLQRSMRSAWRKPCLKDLLHGASG